MPVGCASYHRIVPCPNACGCLPRAWLDAHPLTRADLDQGRDYLKQFEIKLQVCDSKKLAVA